MTNNMLRTLVLLGITLVATQARAGNTEISYFGTNLFAGVAYHRWGCAINGPYSNSTVNTNNTYQGFSQTQYCHQGWTWTQENSSASKYYGCASNAGDSGCASETPGAFTVTNTSVSNRLSTTSGYLTDAYLGYYFGAANWDYGLPLVGASSYTDYRNYSRSLQSGYTNNTTAGVYDRDPSGVPNYCSYNVLTNCNSDCWIYDFSTRQGATAPTLSPCW